MAVVAVGRSSGVIRVAVAPVTHAMPEAERCAVEVPTAVKALLKLDGQRSWVICDELNEFNWPGYDAAKTPDGRTEFGRLPHAVAQKIQREAAAARRRGALKITDRD